MLLPYQILILQYVTLLNGEWLGFGPTEAALAGWIRFFEAWHLYGVVSSCYYQAHLEKRTFCVLFCLSLSGLNVGNLAVLPMLLLPLLFDSGMSLASFLHPIAGSLLRPSTITYLRQCLLRVL